MAANTGPKPWSSTDKGTINFKGESFRMHLIEGPRKNDVATVLTLADNPKMIDKILSALAKAETP